MIEILSILATYGLSVILTTAAGPFGIIYKATQALGALKCFMCTSVWVGLFMALVTASTLTELIVYTVGFSGGAILLDRMIQ